MMKNFLLAVFLCFSVSSFAICNYTSLENLATYYLYSENEIQHLKDVESDFEISRESLKKWDEAAMELIRLNKLDYYEYVRLLTYLYIAQEEAAALSYKAHQSLKGSLDPLSEAVIKLFCPKYSRPENYEADIYSAKLRNLILPRLKERFRKENQTNKAFELKSELKANPETYYKAGTKVAKWIPWVATNSESYWPELPPETDEEWAYQVAEIKNQKKDLTPEKMDRILFWAGEKGPGSGEWIKIMNDYIFSHDITVGKILFVRSQFMKGFYDATIAYYGAKYHYSVIRPKVRDPEINYEIEMPNHPSYPSGHSSLASVSSTILAFYFPENKEEWAHLANEAGMSRIWAGIHYPIDHKVGMELGRKVASTIIESCPSND